MALNKADREEVYRRTLCAVEADVGEITNVGHCLDFAWHGYQILKAWPSAPRTILQAGTASWPRVPPELDDGVVMTHLTYQWDPDSELVRKFRQGRIARFQIADGSIVEAMPEMHAWLAFPDYGEIIDFTTGLWPAACMATLGEEWLAPWPPVYLWCPAKKLPTGVRYLADRDAIDLAITILHLQGRQYP